MLTGSNQFSLYVKAHTFAVLQKAKNLKKVVCARIAMRPQHTHETLRRNIRCFSDFCEANGSVDVITQDNSGGRNIPCEHALNRLAQKLSPKLRIACGPGTNGLFEITCKGHKLFISFACNPANRHGHR